MPARVVVVVNKWYECNPVMDVLLHDSACPREALGWPTVLRHPHRRTNSRTSPVSAPSNPGPRAVFALPNTKVEIWCVSDLLEHLPDKSDYQSSSEQKMKWLATCFAGEPPRLVVAVGTAARLVDGYENGSVVVGRHAFLHNGHPESDANPNSRWYAGPFDQVITSKLSAEAFDSVVSDGAMVAEILKRFAVPPLPDRLASGQFLARSDGVALGDVNVSSSSEYEKKDGETLRAFARLESPLTAISLETTHGLIVVASGMAPFLFISGIPNAIYRYGQEVLPREYAQNFVASHNAGVALAWMLPRIDKLFA
jgi:hypothetical protein